MKPPKVTLRPRLGFTRPYSGYCEILIEHKHSTREFLTSMVYEDAMLLIEAAKAGTITLNYPEEEDDPIDL